MGASGDAKFTDRNYRIGYNSALCDIAGLIQRRIQSVCASCSSIQITKSELSREEVVNYPN